MISNNNALAVSPRTFLATAAPSTRSHGSSPGHHHRALSSRHGHFDEYSRSEPGALSQGEGTYQRTALSIRSRWRVQETDDGQLRATSQSKLRFQYEFEAADGTRIRIRAKANLTYSQAIDGDEQSQSLRMRVKASVSVVQQNMASDVSSLGESPEVPTDAQAALSRALDFFQQVTTAATSSFLNGNPLDGDKLITELVDAFNELTGTIDMAVPPTADNLPEAAPAEIVESIAEPVVEPLVAPLADAPVSEPAAPIADSTESPVIVPLPDVAPVSDSGSTEPLVSSEPGVASEPVASEPVAAFDADGENTEVAQPVEPADLQSPVSVASVKLRMRFSFVQSLTEITRAFDSDSSTLLVTQSAFRASIQIAARYDVPVPGESSPVSQGQQLDAQV